MPDPRRAIPRTDALLAEPGIAKAAAELGRDLVKSVIQDVQRAARAGELAPADVAATVLARLPGSASSLRPVLNATGVVVHTNL
ncbi:L-seryl-tRNA(Sec) selenium transferase, partial [Amycolatopsis sp. SID8362]|nr:L-seryl-tRNA(Sec) selenium transferase [Amycolatopsis sp. SID8362]NED44885.1 L-seryl-tRNA(Sec) selenium transferase [Amycolatopsis sp. SID8362]